VEVPFENASLPGYFVRARNTTAGPCLLCVEALTLRLEAPMFDYVERIAVAGMLSCAVLCSIPVAAQEGAPFPTKPVRMVIHIVAGSSMDIVGRVLAQDVGRVLAQELTEAYLKEERQ
jgi:hypothetical protein